jgi:Abnormal spindle-like microcephaly-assoc'd, ASPM-SPD-2-Hydin
MRIFSSFAVTLALVAGTSYGQALSPDAVDPLTLTTGAPDTASSLQSIPNPQKFGQVGHPHVLPIRPPEYFQNPAPPPVGAHLSYFGGRVVSNLQVVQVLWGTGSYLAQVESVATPSMASFYPEVLNSSYVDWLSEYDTAGLAAPTTNQIIGRGSFVSQVTITPASNAATIADTTIQSEITRQINAGFLPAPTTDGNGNSNTYYAVFFPHGKTITQGATSSCVSGGFCAYHGTVAAAGSLHEFFYGVHPDMQAGTLCATGCGAAATPFGNYTSVASHEMVETITDAEVGLATVVGPPLAWYDVNNGEAADICNAQQSSVNTTDGQTYVVQKIWSNAQGACVVSGPASASFTVAPGSLAFGNQRTNTKSVAQAVTVTNTGGIALPITSITRTGASPGQFTETDNCRPSVAAGATCTIHVVFAPKAVGARTATLNVNAGGGAGTKSVTLSGTGIAGPYTVSPTTLAFGTVLHGTTSPSQAVTVTNNGSVTLPITSIARSGANAGLFTLTQNCRPSLAAGASCTINVAFAPKGLGAKTAILSVTTGAGAGTQAVSLSGTGN